MALLIVGASLKASISQLQFDYLCKKGAFPGLRSKRSCTEGFQMLEKELPLISCLTDGKGEFPRRVLRSSLVHPQGARPNCGHARTMRARPNYHLLQGE